MAPIHRAAIPAGPIQLADHLSFVVGALIRVADVDRQTTSLREGIRIGGMPWWARRVFTMTSRLALLPAAAIVWFSPATAYRLADGAWPFVSAGARTRSPRAEH